MAATPSAGASQSSGSRHQPRSQGLVQLPRCHRCSQPRRGRVMTWTQRAGPPTRDGPGKNVVGSVATASRTSDHLEYRTPDHRSPQCQPDNGSPIAPVASSYGPCASRLTSGAPASRGGATWRNPVSTSSGRTAGTVCRSTTVEPRPRVVRRDVQGEHGRAAVERAQPLLRHPLDGHRRAGEEGLGCRGDRGRRQGEVDLPPADLEAVGQAAGLASTTSRTSSPSGRERSRSSARRAGSTVSARPISRYSASLAAPVGDAPAYEMRGCGLKPEEYAIGMRARTSARSNARLKSR